MNLWEKFFRSGKIEDYLNYKNSEEGRIDEDL